MFVADVVVVVVVVAVVVVGGNLPNNNLEEAGLVVSDCVGFHHPIDGAVREVERPGN
jgi:hypothetical protein